MIEFINKYVIGATLPILLMLTGVYFFAKLGFFPFTKSQKVICGITQSKKGGFKALALSLAGTLGVGNIVGVTSAIYAGGFGAIFWMWISASVASILKYSEIVLAMRHRVPADGGCKGGAPYYIRACLAPKFPLLARLLSVLFAMLCISNCLSMGAVMQTNAISSALGSVCGIRPAVCGALIAVAALFLMRGGTEVISRLTSALVPFMGVFYTLLSLAVIIPRAHAIPSLLGQVIASAFSIDAAAGGIFGFLLSRSLRFGVVRGLFSNEAGCGTSPTAHVSSASSPCEQGFIGIIEVLIDTVLLCTMTAVVVMLNYDSVVRFGDEPMKMALKAYSSSFSPTAGMVIEWSMALMVLCFGFATISCLSHYALECVSFLSKKPIARQLFVPIYCASIFAGALADASLAWAVSDLTVGVMTVINLGVLWYKRDEIASETADYFGKSKNICQIDNKFTKWS